MATACLLDPTIRQRVGRGRGRSRREPPHGGGGGGDATPVGAAVPGSSRAVVHPLSACCSQRVMQPPIGDGADPQALGGGVVRCILPHQMQRSMM